MFWRSIRSGLYIDYENIPQNLIRKGLGGLIHWLEDGQFDDKKRKRQLVTKRVYWNSSTVHHRDDFTGQGFATVLCEKHAGLKNAADIKLALDIYESVLKADRIDEYIIVSSDTDFIPLLQRLRTHGKRSVMVVDQSKPTVYTSFNYHADRIITQRVFLEAIDYHRKTRSWFSRSGSANGSAVPPAATPAPQPPKINDLAAAIEDAERRVIQVISLNPEKPTARRKIIRALREVKGLRTTGAKGDRDPIWLGFKSYDGLMVELASRSARIKIVKTPEGFYVTYAPKDDN